MIERRGTVFELEHRPVAGEPWYLRECGEVRVHLGVSEQRPSESLRSGSSPYDTRWRGGDSSVGRERYWSRDAVG